MSRLALAAALSLALTAPALAWQADAGPVATAGPAAAAPKSKMICRTTPRLGSRLEGKRECATAEEWARMQAEHREALQKQQTLGLRGE